MALSTVILNYCIAFQQHGNSKGLDTITTAVTKLVPMITDVESLFRFFVTTGTLVHDANLLIKEEIISKLQANVDFRLKLSNYAVMSNESTTDLAMLKLVKCSKQVYDLLQN